jgi:dolichol kinase
MPVQEIFRKIIHLSSLCYPLFYLLTNDKLLVLVITGTIFLMVLSIDVLRIFNKNVNDIFCKYLKFTIRENEKKGFTGSTYFMCGTFFTILLFPRDIAIVSLCVLVISDTCASVVGISIGRIKLVGNKSLEGTLAFFISALTVSYFGWVYFGLLPYLLFISSFVTTIMELFNTQLKCDDNILIPVGFASVYLFAEIIVIVFIP